MGEPLPLDVEPPAPAPVWRLVVAGDPRKKGDVVCIGGRGGRHQIIWKMDAAGKAWRKHLTAAVEDLARRLGEPMQGPVAVGALHVLPRGTTVTRPLPHVGGTGDVDKHARMTLDAITDGGAFGDDTQVIGLQAFKVYSAPGRPAGLHLFLSAGQGRYRRILDAILAAAPELEG